MLSLNLAFLFEIPFKASLCVEIAQNVLETFYYYYNKQFHNRRKLYFSDMFALIEILKKMLEHQKREKSVNIFSSTERCKAKFNLHLHLTGSASLKKHTAILTSYSAPLIEYTHWKNNNQLKMKIFTGLLLLISWQNSTARRKTIFNVLT